MITSCVLKNILEDRRSLAVFKKNCNALMAGSATMTMSRILNDVLQTDQASSNPVLTQLQNQQPLSSIDLTNSGDYPTFISDKIKLISTLNRERKSLPQFMQNGLIAQPSKNYHSMQTIMVELGADRTKEWVELVAAIAYFDIYEIKNNQESIKPWVEKLYTDIFSGENNRNSSKTITLPDFAVGLFQSSQTNIFPTYEPQFSHVNEELHEELMGALRKYPNSVTEMTNTYEKRIVFFQPKHQMVQRFLQKYKQTETENPEHSASSGDESEPGLTASTSVTPPSPQSSPSGSPRNIINENGAATTSSVLDNSTVGLCTKDLRIIAAVPLLMISAVCIVLAIGTFGVATPLSAWGMVVSVSLLAQILTIGGAAVAAGAATFFAITSRDWQYDKGFATITP